METLLGTTLDVWIGVTVVLTGGAGYMTGQAIARTWRPLWQVVAYSLLLALVSRFFVYALFDGYMLLASGYIIDAAVIMPMVCCFAVLEIDDSLSAIFFNHCTGSGLTPS